MAQKVRLIQRGLIRGMGLLLCSALLVLGSAPYAFPLTMEEIARELMSPACPGRLLIDCTSGEAAQLRQLISQKIEKGESKDQIIQYFLEAYGPEVLPSPPKKGFFWTLWGFPFLMIINAGLVILLLGFIWVRRRKASAARGRISEAHEEVLEGDHGLDVGARPSADPGLIQRVEKELRDFKD